MSWFGKLTSLSRSVTKSYITASNFKLVSYMGLPQYAGESGRNVKKHVMKRNLK
jgi:hypothetical protein